VTSQSAGSCDVITGAPKHIAPAAGKWLLVRTFGHGSKSRTLDDERRRRKLMTHQVEAASLLVELSDSNGQVVDGCRLRSVALLSARSHWPANPALPTRALRVRVSGCKPAIGGAGTAGAIEVLAGGLGYLRACQTITYGR